MAKTTQHIFISKLSLARRRYDFTGMSSKVYWFSNVYFIKPYTLTCPFASSLWRYILCRIRKHRWWGLKQRSCPQILSVLSCNDCLLRVIQQLSLKRKAQSMLFSLCISVCTFLLESIIQWFCTFLSGHEKSCDNQVLTVDPAASYRVWVWRSCDSHSWSSTLIPSAFMIQPICCWSRRATLDMEVGSCDRKSPMRSLNIVRAVEQWPLSQKITKSSADSPYAYFSLVPPIDI